MLDKFDTFPETEFLKCKKKSMGLSARSHGATASATATCDRHQTVAVANPSIHMSICDCDFVCATTFNVLLQKAS